MVNTAVAAVAILMVLQELDINIMPVLTGAGIAGLAVGFGAQTLVRDVISGFFLILEDQVRVGDVASINGTGGLVEAINLRTIVLRDLSGTVHVFPNGAVQQMSNLTKDFSFYVLDMGVAYKEDTDQVVEVLKAVAEEQRQDPAYAANILGPLEVLGVDAFGDSAVTVKVRIKTVPIQQWAVGREYRRRVKKAFDARGIEIPFPHMSVYFGEASKPWLFRDAGAARRPDADGTGTRRRATQGVGRRRRRRRAPSRRRRTPTRGRRTPRRGRRTLTVSSRPAPAGEPRRGPAARSSRPRWRRRATRRRPPWP